MSSNCCFKGNFKILSPFNKPNKHNITMQGMELAGITSIRAFSTCDGEVIKTGYEPNGYGKYMIIKSEDGFFHIFAHFSSMSVKEGERVYKGRTGLGIMGLTGKVKDKCIYYEIRSNRTADYYNIDPANYMRIPNQMGTFNSEKDDQDRLILPKRNKAVETVDNSVDNSSIIKYFEKCDESFTTLENALYSIGEDNSQKSMYQIAQINSIVGYRGQLNNKAEMLKRLKKGELIKP